MAKPKKSKKKSKVGAHPKVQSIQHTSNSLEGYLRNSRLHIIALMVLSLILYANTLTHDYTQDDAIVIYDNMFTTKGVKGIPGILKYDTFYGFFKEEGKANLVTGGRYRPFTLMMYALEVQLFAKKKKDANGQVVKDNDGDTVFDPKGEDRTSNAVKFVGHLVNILLYGLTGVILYFLLLNLLAPKSRSIEAHFVALVTAAIFIAHPIHTEAVANIKGRDEIMTLLGSLAAAYFILKSYRSGNSFSIAAAACFFVALMSKENAITFIGAVPLMLYIFTKAKPGQIFSQTLALIAPAILFLIIRAAVLPDAGISERSMELMNNPYLKIEAGQWVHFTSGERLATIFYTLGKYVQLLIFPHPLTHDYYPRHIDLMTWSDWQSIGSLLLYIGLAVYGLIGLLKKDKLSFGILYYLGTLLIVSNLIFPVGTNMSERFLFMPSVGFCFVVAILLYRLAKKMNNGALSRADQLQTTLLIAAVLIILLGIKTISRNAVWKDNFTLFTTDVAVSENSAKLQNAVGGELLRIYNPSNDQNLRIQKITEAVEHLNKAIEIHPTYKNSYLQLGNANNYLKNYEQSIQYYNKVLAMDPDDENAINNLGITYRDAGRYYGEEKQDLSNAIKYLQKAYELRPNEYETLRLLGVAYGVSGQQQKAIDFFSKALALDEQNPDALWNLGNAYKYAGDTSKANELLQRARAIDPNVGQPK
jgi:Flp pilus assembly protein TadD